MRDPEFRIAGSEKLPARPARQSAAHRRFLSPPRPAAGDRGGAASSSRTTPLPRAFIRTSLCRIHSRRDSGSTNCSTNEPLAVVADFSRTKERNEADGASIYPRVLRSPSTPRSAIRVADEQTLHDVLIVLDRRYDLVAERGQKPEVSFDQVGAVQRDVEKIVCRDHRAEQAQNRDRYFQGRDVRGSAFRRRHMSCITIGVAAANRHRSEPEPARRRDGPLTPGGLTPDEADYCRIAADRNIQIRPSRRQVARRRRVTTAHRRRPKGRGNRHAAAARSTSATPRPT